MIQRRVRWLAERAATRARAKQARQQAAAARNAAAPPPPPTDPVAPPPPAEGDEGEWEDVEEEALPYHQLSHYKNLGSKLVCDHESP